MWTGVIRFGLVSVPVALFSAIRPHEVTFHQFERGTTDRIRYQRVNERTGAEVDQDDIVKGADVGDDEYVLVEQSELDAIAPGQSHSLDIHTFVDLDEINPIYFERTYYLAPGSDETIPTYALLRAAMADTNRAAVASLVMRGKEYLATVRADGDLLVLETMYFADEVRDPRAEIDRYPDGVRIRTQELRMANLLIDSMSGTWDPADYRDTYTDRVHDLIDAKRAGATIPDAERAPGATNVIDLMDVLRRSVAAANQKRNTAPVRRPSVPRQRERTLRSMTRDELAVLARELNVPGRSSMTRMQLEEAVAYSRRSS
jgi:DNA end-binding protein Ku